MSAAAVEGLRDVVPADCLDTWRSPDGGELLRVAPRTLEQWQDTLRHATANGLRLFAVGRGSKLRWCHPAEHADLVLSTRNWQGVLAYEPGDGTLSARSGSTMADLSTVVEEGGHALTPDVPAPADATLGGVLAAGQSGFDRLLRGAVRENCLGLEVLLADGRTAKSGGRLVKNVTGYDLHRLYCGSHGTLCVILEASLRLSSLPRTWGLLRARFAERATALERCRALRETPLRPLAVAVHDLEPAHEPWSVVVALAGRQDVVAWEAERALEVLPGAQVLHGPEARSAIEATRDLERRAGAWPALVLSALPTHLADALRAADEAAATEGLRAPMLIHPWIASASVWLEEPDPAREQRPERLPRLHQRLFSPDWRVEWHGAPDDLRRRIDLFGSSPSHGLPLMQRLKHALDPQGVFARGRFHGHI